MGPLRAAATALAFFFSIVNASPYREDLTAYNLNTNKDATDPTQYSTTRSNTTYTHSPENWRSLPVYTILLDKWADGDPSNNDYFQTMFEYDYRETQLRSGGDLRGLVSRLDYLQGMGIKVIYISGTPFLNMLWQADSYSPLDMTVLDPHWGTWADWVSTIDEIHARGMYFMADLTGKSSVPALGTMADLLGFTGHLNSSATFSVNEYNVQYKLPDYIPWNFSEYRDFQYSNTENTSCVYPTFYDDDGTVIPISEIGVTSCMESDFDQYGDMEAFGVHPDWQRQLSKFASVQDRLREWKPEVMDKLTTFSCMVITALDIDAIRIDKATQVTVDALANWATATRKCAFNLGKTNFYIPGEVTGGDTFGSIYLGRGRTPDQRLDNITATALLTPDQSERFLRDNGTVALDGCAFHYSIYRALTRFLGMDGNLAVAYDLDTNFVNAWNQILLDNDFINSQTDNLDPRHMYGTSNFDVFRWPSLANGTQRSALGTFVTSMVMPGLVMYYYGEEQAFYIYDDTASNYLYGRQAMPGNLAWKRHGCYQLGSEQYFNMPLDKATLGCHDDWNALDHFDPTADSRRLFAQFNYLRTQFVALQDGLSLTDLGNWTYQIQRPGSNGTDTEMGLWSISRAEMPNVQNLTGTNTGQVWLLYTNENSTKTRTYDCNSTLWISSPYESGTVVRNLFYPYESYTLAQSSSSFNKDGGAPWTGCLANITMDGYGFKALVPDTEWIAPPPALTGFTPGHDYRINSETSGASVDISLEFNTDMDCQSVTQSITLSMSGINGGSTPSISNVNCGAMTSSRNVVVQGVSRTQWSWNATLTNFPDGILNITITKPSASNGNTTGSVDTLLLRKGLPNNVMVFPENDYNASALTKQGDDYMFTHSAYGAEMFRYSWNFGQNWTNWTTWEATTTVNLTAFADANLFWDGDHIVVQYWSSAVMSSSHVVHSDYGWSGFARRVPQLIATGGFNEWGNNKGIENTFKQTGDGLWAFTYMYYWPAYFQVNVWGQDNYFYGDVDGDGVLDRLAPNSGAPNYLNMSAPPLPHLSWTVFVNDSTMSWYLEPHGREGVAATMYALLVSMPLITGTLAVLIFMWSFYGIKYNQYGVKAKTSYFPILGALGGKSSKHTENKDGVVVSEKKVHRSNTDIIGWPEDSVKRRKVLIATLEYEIIDWKLKVKIGGLGVMSTLIGKAMSDVDLLWVVPKVKDLEYPAGDPADPFEVIIFGEPYLIEVETHTLDNITYVILDSPVFRAQTKADPYPARMDDLSSAIFYSTWNQAIAATVRRYPTVDVYHINDYHGALAPIYLLPKVLPVCLSLHNAEFQGLWPLRTKEEMKEVCSAFNITKEHCTKYVQFGNTFNLLHAAASFISVHQKSIGVAGVSDKYGKRSWARYPALWTLKHVDSLPNPDPTDIAALDENPTDAKSVVIDEDPNSDLFVFVGRWSKQKGVDLIADVMPSLLEKRPSIQLITVGPVIDLYGRFAAEKLARLMEIYPDRVYSKPEFTALPPFLFSGADFALIPSRDEPFGLVAVEFGRKGALGVGSRLGGLGLMPGWWFPVESSSTAHMLSQLTKTIKMALKSSEEERAILRARSAVQRFPVVEWRQRMEDFHRRSIIASRDQASADAWRESDCDGGTGGFRATGENEDWNPVSQEQPSQPGWDHLASPMGSPSLNNSVDSFAMDDPASVSPRLHPGDDDDSSRSGVDNSQGYDDFLNRANRAIARDQRNAPDPFLDAPGGDFKRPARPFSSHSRMSSASSLADVADEHSNSPLNKAIASFTDADGGVATDFVQKLQELNAKNSEHELSIEKFLTKSEEKFFDKVKKDKISSAASVRSSQRDSVWGTPDPSVYSRPSSPSIGGSFPTSDWDSAQSPPEGAPMTRLQVFMTREIGGWPLYTIIIALGQTLCATSFQITLLTGHNWQSSVELYIIGGVFLAASAVWYPLFRLRPSIYVLSAPWVFFGLAFFLIGLPSVSSSLNGAHKILSSIATWSYAVASAAGFLFFGLNFGEEAGAATEVWMLRACIVQGSQQIWVAVLWYWGYKLNSEANGYTPPWWICVIVWPLAALCFLFCYLMLHGLPEYYRQTPPKVPNFLKTLFRRRIVVWFLISVILQTYWLSGPYGQNWFFLWNSDISTWKTLLLVLAFFVGVWSLLLYILTYFSKTHTWLLPVFAVGLGAPRWCQIYWGVSGIATYVPWAGGGGPYLAVGLWLWLGVLDSIQGVGLGLILLQTLSRLHVTVTLAFSQILGSAIVMIARATAPDALGAGTVFPNPGVWDPQNGLTGSPIVSPMFWLCLAFQLIVVVGYFWFYRREELARP
ncbi:hypothetical protein D9757_002866 [Collybiopsis confluens]|uniref:alpha-1,3-glucan synthase n=1 Tax=Collybiopsis confluens TaxID=2823264 RepID=A0A8H5MDZ1_9AGAR|nr:hypothetical protein D9757_002866 [Collybiopsis confluens]